MAKKKKSLPEITLSRDDREILNDAIRDRINEMRDDAIAEVKKAAKVGELDRVREESEYAHSLERLVDDFFIDDLDGTFVKLVEPDDESEG